MAIPGESFSCGDGRITASTAGSGLTEAGDSFHFSYRLEPGDFDVRVEVEKLSGPASIGGLMVRETLDPRSAYLGVFVARTATGDVWRVLGRPSDSVPEPLPVDSVGTNAWLRLARKGANR